VEVKGSAFVQVTTFGTTAGGSSLTRVLEGTKAVFFDFGGTLAYRARSVFEVWQTLVAKAGETTQRPPGLQSKPWV